MAGKQCWVNPSILHCCTSETRALLQEPWAGPANLSYLRQHAAPKTEDLAGTQQGVVAMWRPEHSREWSSRWWNKYIGHIAWWERKAPNQANKKSHSDIPFLQYGNLSSALITYIPFLLSLPVNKYLKFSLVFRFENLPIVTDQFQLYSYKLEIHWF